MTATAPEGGASPQDTGDDINTGGAGNTDLHGAAREIVEAGDEGATGPTPGGG